MGIFDGVLLASDLDGTLYNSEHAVSEQNLTAIARFIAEGGTFTVATGRAIQSFQRPKQEVPINAPVVLANGALIHDFSRDTILRVVPLSGAYLSVCREVALTFPWAAVEAHLIDDIWVAHLNEVTKAHLTIVGAKGHAVDRVDDIPSGWLKALFTGDTADLQTLFDWFVPRYGAQYDLLFSTPHFLELQDKLANKGEGVAFVAAHLGVAEEHVYCVGDQQNDLSMLRRFYSFATGNAQPDIQHAARQVVADCDNHAVADVIDRLTARYRR